MITFDTSVLAQPWDVILVNTSAGKDSVVALDVVYRACEAAGCAAAVHVVHADLGRVEWAGTCEFAQEQAARYGIPFQVVSRGQDLLDHVEQRGMWPSSSARYCTSDHKRDQVAKLITALVNTIAPELGRPVRILNVMGLRAQESPARSKRQPLARNKRSTNGRREVWDWLPIHAWTEDEVWQHIRSHSLKYHYAYDLGMPRLSCVFCIFAPEPALKLAGFYNRELLREYVAVEKRTGHDFRHQQPLVQIERALEAGYVPQRVDPSLWKQCA